MAAINDVFLVTLAGTCNSQRILLTQHYFLKTLTGTTLTDVEAQQLLLDYWEPLTLGSPMRNYLSCLSTDYTCNEVWAQKLAPIRVRKSIATLVGAVGEYAAGNATNLAAAITLQTANAGRSQVATKHVGPIATDSTAITDGLIASGLADNLSAFAADLVADPSFSSGDVVFAPCIWHGGTVVNKDEVEVAIVRNTVRTMRRRTVGLGE